MRCPINQQYLSVCTIICSHCISFKLIRSNILFSILQKEHEECGILKQKSEEQDNQIEEMKKDIQRLSHQNDCLMRQHVLNTKKIDELEAGKMKEATSPCKETPTAGWIAVALPIAATLVPIITAFCFGNRQSGVLYPASNNPDRMVRRRIQNQIIIQQAPRPSIYKYNQMIECDVLCFCSDSTLFSNF